jgi:hypothetical protein
VEPPVVEPPVVLVTPPPVLEAVVPDPPVAVDVVPLDVVAEPVPVAVLDAACASSCANGSRPFPFRLV